jgi:putative spermidine/putrescine transport system ATP-binding protein
VTADLELRQVTKAYRGTTAVDRVSFEVAPRSFFSLLGPSGCGKTTLLRLIAGFLAPDAGEVRIRDEVVNQLPPYRRNTAMVFQNYALFPHMTVEQNVAFGLRYRMPQARDEARRVGEALELVLMSGSERKYPAQLSGGQQQRVALARAIVTQPALLLLDEPLSNLDLRLRQGMRRELRRLQKELQITTIYVTHDQAEAFSMSDSIGVMSAGNLLQVGTPADIFRRPADSFVVTFIGDTNHFSGRVTEVSGTGIQIRTTEGLKMTCTAPSPDFTPGQTVELYFREELVNLRDSPGGPNAFPAVIDHVLNLGSLLTISAKVGAASTIRSTVPATAENWQRQPGDKVVLQVAEADVVVLPAKDGTA